MTNETSPSIFESFNARHLNPAQVAKTFVSPRQYLSLSKRCNSVIVGPRGSGKTTLLKMLQPSALQAWEHPAAQTVRSKLDFTGVFIPTDLSWSVQLGSLGGGRLDDVTLKLLGNAAFSTHILKSLVEAMMSRLNKPDLNEIRFRGVTLSDDDEVILAKQLCEAWHIQSTIPSLFSLKQALSQRIVLIGMLANREAALGENGRQDRLSTYNFLYLNYLDAATIAVEMFNDVVKEDGAKWALLFDELELAPAWIQDDLIKSLRATNALFIYKLALSPYSHSARILELETGLGPSPDQDFEYIPLWYVDRNQGLHFCNDLWDAMLLERGIAPISPKESLGLSYFESEVPDQKIDTKRKQNKRSVEFWIKELSKEDVTFRTFLQKHEIDPDGLSTVSREKRDAIIRKIAPLIPLRSFYRARDSDSRARKIIKRTRKNPTIFAGADSLFAISEGNPRWFIAIVGRILERCKFNPEQIKQNVQAEEMMGAAQRFAAMLRTIPVPASPAVKSTRGLLGLIERIGTHFHKQVVVGDFVADPVGSFSVDPDIDEDVHTMLKSALNAGAIVFVPGEFSHRYLSSLKSKRFRLSYILAPLYGFPTRLGVQASLGKILRESHATAEMPVGLFDDAEVQ